MLWGWGGGGQGSELWSRGGVLAGRAARERRLSPPSEATGSEWPPARGREDSPKQGRPAPWLGETHSSARPPPVLPSRQPWTPTRGLEGPSARAQAPGLGSSQRHVSVPPRRLRDGDDTHPSHRVWGTTWPLTAWHVVCAVFRHKIRVGLTRQESRHRNSSWESSPV